MTYGYARCSLAEEKGQDLNRQVCELKAAGAEQIITEREHGDARNKEHLSLLLEAAQPGDTIICTELGPAPLSHLADAESNGETLGLVGATLVL